MASEISPSWLADPPTRAPRALRAFPRQVSRQPPGPRRAPEQAAESSTLDVDIEFGSRDGIEGSRLRLSLFGGWRLCRGVGGLALSMGGRRLVALLALTGAQTRSYLAGTLWPEASEERARGSLRSVLWRLQQLEPGLLDTSPSHLALRDDVEVDVRDFVVGAHRMLRDPNLVPPLALLTHPGLGLRMGEDLLPGWYDEWVLHERERLRQLRVHALEVLVDGLLRRGRYGEALEVGLAAIRAEPLRESAHRAVVRVHLAEGNGAEALRQYEHYRDLLVRELGVKPSERIVELMQSIQRVR